MTPPTAANDNQPRQAEEFDDLAARRAWLATLPEKYKPVLAWPTFERLSRLENPTAADALYRYAELMAPSHEVAANDNEPAASVQDPDMVHETRPSIGELLRAAAEGLRCRVVSLKTSAGWEVQSRHEASFGQSEEGFRLGGLIFRGGVLVSYGETSKGKPKRPAERTRQPKGSKPSSRSVSDIRFLLPANDKTPIADGSGWLGGVTRARGNCTRPDIGDHAAAQEMARTGRQRAIRLALGLDAAVLDAATTDATAREIGEAFGFTGKTAERQGIRRINAAIEKFQALVA